MARRVAVVDTGTNSTRLLVVDIEAGQLRELERRTEITRLGEGVAATGRLSPEAMERVRRCFDGYAKITAYLEAVDTLLLATSSVRDAADGKQFIESLAKGAVYDYRVLSGTQEAELAFVGATIGQPSDLRLLVADIGGGSTELAAGINGEVEEVASLDLGCVRLNERFLHSDPPMEEERNTVKKHVHTLLKEHEEVFTDIDRLIGVAGTVTSLAALDLGLGEYDRGLVHGHVLLVENIERITATLAEMTAAERKRYGTLEPGRADVIVAGALILQELMGIAGAGELFVSENDILDGAALRYWQREL